MRSRHTLRQITVLFFIALGFARSAGAQMADLSTMTLMRMTTTGGFVPAHMHGWESGVQVRIDGGVYAFQRSNGKAPRVYREIARMGDEQLQWISAAIAAIPLDEELVLEGDSPACTDAPSTVFVAGADEFASNVLCRDAYRGNSYRARQLVTLLRGFETLAFLGEDF